MRIFRFVLFSLCLIGLAAVLAISTLPKPAAQKTAALRPEILQSLQQAVRLAGADDALKLVDKASRFPNKTKLEVMEIDQVRDFVLRQEERPRIEHGLGPTPPPT